VPGLRQPNRQRRRVIGQPAVKRRMRNCQPFATRAGSCSLRERPLSRNASNASAKFSCAARKLPSYCRLWQRCPVLIFVQFAALLKIRSARSVRAWHVSVPRLLFA